MPVNESAAAAVIKAELLAIDYGGPLTPEAQAIVENIGDACAKCIGHYAANNTVSTNITGVVTGATPAPPTVGVFNGTGMGTVAGLIKGDALSGTGLAGEIMTVLEGADYGGTVTAVARAQLALIADAVAVFADHVATNAVVSTTDTGPGTTPGVKGPTSGTGTGNAT